MTDSMTVVEVLQLVVIPLVLAVLRDVRSARAELTTARGELSKMGERVAALETAVEIGLGVKPSHPHNRRRGD